MRVLVAHSGMQHAHQLAWGLYEGNDLQAFWSGVPVADPADGRRGWSRLSGGLNQVPVPRRLRRHFPVFPVLRRAAAHVATPDRARGISHKLDHLFDWMVASQLAKQRPDLVVAYENAAYHTFRMAKKIGAICVLDAASLHYSTAEKFRNDGWMSDPPWVTRRKQDEIDLADAILACSPLAAQSYTEAGVPPKKIVICPLGAQVPESIRRVARTNDLLQFLFVGNIGRVKGIDLLLDVFEDINQGSVKATLTLIGGITEPHYAVRAKAIAGVTIRPFVPQTALFAEMAKFDCLVLPSRFDSFGMVVAEAMSLGLPAIISDRVGSKLIIEAHSDAGWVVPFGREALKAQIQALIDRPAQLESASKAARLAARNYTWAAYRGRVVSLLHRIEGELAK